jgi:hypothetical protein
MKLNFYIFFGLISAALASLANLNSVPLVKMGVQSRFSIKPYERKIFKIRKEDYKSHEKYEVRISWLGNVKKPVPFLKTIGRSRIHLEMERHQRS